MRTDKSFGTIDLVDPIGSNRYLVKLEFPDRATPTSLEERKELAAMEIHHLDLRAVFNIRANFEDRDLQDTARDIEKLINAMPSRDAISKIRLEVHEHRATKR